MTSWHRNVSALLALCEGNPPVTGGSPRKCPEMRSFNVPFNVSLNKLIKQTAERQLNWYVLPPIWCLCIGFNYFAAEAGLLPDNRVNTIAADALVTLPWIIRNESLSATGADFNYLSVMKRTKMQKYISGEKLSKFLTFWEMSFACVSVCVCACVCVCVCVRICVCACVCTYV